MTIHNISGAYMKSIFSSITLSALAVMVFSTMMLSLPDQADAKRLGMGSSFGKTFNKPQTSPSMNQNFSQKQAVPGKSSTGSASPARGGMMGMLGGLALGGLLGAMFFGGAFEGINLFDMLIVGAIIFFVFFLLRKKAPASNPAYAYAGQQQVPHEEAFTASAESAQSSGGVSLRPDIDASHFTAAARDIFIRMQKAWDAHDMDDIKSFCTAEVAQRVASDLQHAGHNKTEVAMLQADIVDSWIESELEWVAVHFTAMLREQSLDTEGNVTEESSGETTETWIFRHDPASNDPTWFLAGIQQAN